MTNAPILAPMAGRCALCGDEYPAGTPITFYRGMQTNGWITAALCYEDDEPLSW